MKVVHVEIYNGELQGGVIHCRYNCAIDRFKLVIIGVQRAFQRAAQRKRMCSNQHDLDVVSSSVNQVRFHPRFEKLDQAVGFAKAQVSLAFTPKLFNFLG